MDSETLRDEARAGRIGIDRLVEMVARLETAVARLEAELEAARRETDAARREADASRRALEAARREVDELKARLAGAAAKPSLAYSVGAEERRQEAAGTSKRRRKAMKAARRGRLKTADKVALAGRHEDVSPAGVAPERCTLSQVRPVWRLEQGRAVLVAYHIYRCGMLYGQVPGGLGRCEFGIEIILAIAYQVYVVGLSLDKVCAVFGFFQNLKLTKSQADALLNRLAREWESEFEILCTLLANSAVVHADETGWSIHSVWAFLSEKVRLLFYGVHQDGATLKNILDPETFGGLVISDDAAVYAKFTHSQKCWAHLIRKAIKLTLLEPENADYRAFADGLLEIYRAACRIQRDGRLGDAGRARKVAELEDALARLCLPHWRTGRPTPGEVETDWRRLVQEVMKLMREQELFPFVTAPPVTTVHGEKPVAGTNNEAEGTLRNPAMARDTGRTSKTPKGARRRTIIHSVIESLRAQLPQFTLQAIVDEVKRWSQTARSCFAELAEKLGLGPPERSILDQVMPATAAAKA